MKKETKQKKECDLCSGTGLVEFVLPFPLSNGETVERSEETCPACGKEK